MKHAQSPTQGSRSSTRRLTRWGLLFLLCGSSASACGGSDGTSPDDASTGGNDSGPTGGSSSGDGDGDGSGGVSGDGDGDGSGGVSGDGDGDGDGDATGGMGGGLSGSGGSAMGGMGGEPSTDPTCDDELKNGDESDVDCGGDTCEPCGDGSACQRSIDCDSTLCLNDICTELGMWHLPSEALTSTSPSSGGPLFQAHASSDIMAWLSANGTYSTRHYDGNDWSPAQTIYSDNMASGSSMLAWGDDQYSVFWYYSINGTGNAPYGVRRRDFNGTSWGSTETVPINGSTTVRWFESVGDRGLLWLARSLTQVVHEFSDGVLGPEVIVASDAYNPIFRASTGGHAVLVWRNLAGTESRARRYDAASGWGEEEVLGELPASPVAIDDEGNIFLHSYQISSAENRLFFWHHDDALPQELEHEYTTRMGSTKGTFDSEGNLLVAYYTVYSPARVECIYRSKDGTWGEVETVSDNNTGVPYVTRHGNDGFHILFQERNGTADFDLVAHRYVPGLGPLDRQDLAESDVFDNVQDLMSFSDGKAIVGFDRYTNGTGQPGDQRVIWYY